MTTPSMSKGSVIPLSVAALGIVYGDIGTSPLYALRESLGTLAITQNAVLGVSSLILWSLIIIISLKYLWLVLRADNQGEGGILTLLALLKGESKNPNDTKPDTSTFPRALFFLAIFGAGLMLGDGMLTPAISVVSAIEGIDVVSPALSGWIIPLALVILVSLFSIQHLGTERIGRFFGPIIFIWFATIATLGTIQIIANPFILKAINPQYAVAFVLDNGVTGYTLLGGVFLVVTGGEALYADLGHFGKLPIRLSWFLVALPSLLLNYFGQAAYLLDHPAAISNPFFMISPSWFTIPLVVIATLATIIASQAVISATFSLIRQAVLLGLYPHLPIIQTSEKTSGQIYIPQMNIILALGTVFCIFYFQSSSAMTHAYGITINLVMVLTTLMLGYLAYTQWKWPIILIILLFSIFLSIDCLFLGANLHKVPTGGWVPITLALLCAFIMHTWNKGMTFMRNYYYKNKEDLSKILKQLHYKSLYRLPDTTAIFVTDVYDKSGGSFLNVLKLNRAIPENILLVSYHVQNIPYVHYNDRYELKLLDPNVCQLTLHYGFMDFISIPQALYTANDRQLLPFEVNVDTATYFVEIPNIIPSKRKSSLLVFWQQKLFSFLIRNYSANLNIEFYQLPYNRTIAIGTYCIM